MRKGFTLIELLAVIVILAIIALIATPIILGIINDAKEDSNKRSIENYAHAVELAVARYAAGNGGVIPTGEYTINGKFIEQGSTKIEIDYKGEELQGKVNVDAKGKISLSEIQFDVDGKKYFYTEEEGVISDGEESSKPKEITYLISPDGTLLYYKGKGDVKIPATLDGIEVKEIEYGAFSKHNAVYLDSDMEEGIAYIYLFDASLEADYKKIITNEEGFEYRIVAPKNSTEILNKYNEIVNAGYEPNLTMEADLFFENGQLVDEDSEVYWETEITSIDLSSCKGLHTIDEGAFKKIKNLKKVILPDNVVDIGNYSYSAFSDTPNLESIEVPFTAGNLPTTWSPIWNCDDSNCASIIYKG